MSALDQFLNSCGAVTDSTDDSEWHTTRLRRRCGCGRTRQPSASTPRARSRRRLGSRFAPRGGRCGRDSVVGRRRRQHVLDVADFRSAGHLGFGERHGLRTGAAVVAVARLCRHRFHHRAAGQQADRGGDERHLERDRFHPGQHDRRAHAAVTALCFSDGLGSLLTLYVPKTFTVTQVASPTTAAPAPATTSPLPPPTRLIGGAPPTTIVAPTTTLGTTPDPTGGHPTTTDGPRTTPPPKRQNQPPGAGGGGGNGGGFAAAPTTTAIGRGNGSTPGSAPTDPTLGSAPVGAHVHGRQAGDQQYPTRAADLSDPKLAGSLAAGHSTGLGWLDWLLLILAGIALAAFARWMLWWRRREGQVVATPTATSARRATY